MGNCNCNKCNSCQNCEQITPTQNCITTCTCSTGQCSDECPNGLQSSECIIYSGVTLKDCANDDFIYTNTSLNVVINTMWSYIKCVGGLLTGTITYSGLDLFDCTSPTPVKKVSAGDSLNTVITNIWNFVKCFPQTITTSVNNAVSTLTTLINNQVALRQPIWTGSYPILVGQGETAPYDNINTAMTEIVKYHHNPLVPVVINLKSGTHTINNTFFTQWNTQSAHFVFQGITGDPLDVIVKNSSNSAKVLNIYNSKIEFNSVKIEGGSQAPRTIVVGFGGELQLTNCIVLTTSSVAHYAMLVTDGGEVDIKNIKFLNNNSGPSSKAIVGTNNAKISYYFDLFDNEGFNNFNDVIYVKNNSHFSGMIGKNLDVQNIGLIVLNNIKNTVFTSINNSNITFNNNIYDIEGGPVITDIEYRIDVNFSNTVSGHIFYVLNNSSVILPKVYSTTAFILGEIKTTSNVRIEGEISFHDSVSNAAVELFEGSTITAHLGLISINSMPGYYFSGSRGYLEQCTVTGSTAKYSLNRGSYVSFIACDNAGATSIDSTSSVN